MKYIISLFLANMSIILWNDLSDVEIFMKTQFVVFKIIKKEF